MECSHLLCNIDEIYDWTESILSLRCKKCSELRDTRLCTHDNFEDLGLSNMDISGRQPKLEFQNCQAKTERNSNLQPAYGNCAVKPKFESCSP